MNLEYFDLVEKVIINDDTLFELRKIIGTRTIGNFKKCGNVFSKHGGSKFSGWSFEKNMQKSTHKSG